MYASIINYIGLYFETYDMYDVCNMCLLVPFWNLGTMHTQIHGATAKKWQPETIKEGCLWEMGQTIE